MNRINKFYQKMTNENYVVDSFDDVRIMYYEYSVDDIKNDMLSYDVLLNVMNDKSTVRITLINTYNSLTKEPIDIDTDLRSVIDKVNNVEDQSEYYIMYHLLKEHNSLNLEHNNYVESDIPKHWLNERVVRHIIDHFKEK